MPVIGSKTHPPTIMIVSLLSECRAYDTNSLGGKAIEVTCNPPPSPLNPSGSVLIDYKPIEFVNIILFYIIICLFVCLFYAIRKRTWIPVYLFVCLFLCDKEKNMNILFWVKVNFYSVTDPTKKCSTLYWTDWTRSKFNFFADSHLVLLIELSHAISRLHRRFFL